MSVHNYLYITAICFGGMLGSSVCLYADSPDGDVTILTDPASPTPPIVQKPAKTEAGSVIHKSLHKQKSTSTASASGSSSTAKSASSVASQRPVLTEIQGSNSSSVAAASVVPTVETGLPVARHGGTESLMTGVGSNISPGWQAATSASAVEPATANVSSTTVDGYVPPDRITSPEGDFVFANLSRKTKNIYPWKSGIFTTKFWIGEGGSALSPTDNVASAWDENWRLSNRGTDNPDDRSGYAPADHAPTVNTFYVALPFNDLADPDKARRWLPPGWYRRPKDGKQVSACKDRWVEIKNSEGRVCYAQWEDVGPLESDHPEYVFGPERPDTLTRAGLDVSPAVAQYLGFADSGYTSWRFVDDEDVQPGPWLKYEELALLYTAMHQEKSSPPPIQRQSEPIDEPSTIDANKKKVGAAKG